MEKWILFHQIGAGGEDSALVRKHIVDFDLKDRIEFLNVAYEGAQAKLREKIGEVEAPVLIVGEKILRGSREILDFLKTNA